MSNKSDIMKTGENGGTRRFRKRRAGQGIIAAAALTAAMSFSPAAMATAQAADSIVIQMPGYTVEQWNSPRLMLAGQDAAFFAAPDQSGPEAGRITAGQLIRTWGRTDTGWYFLECGGAMGYVQNEAVSLVTGEQLVLLQQAVAQGTIDGQNAQLINRQAEQEARLHEQAVKEAKAAAEAAEKQAAQAAALAARQAQIDADAARQPLAAAGIVFIGDSRMVSLKETVERNLGVCPAAVIAKDGSRYDWFEDSAIAQADRITGKGTKVVINMGVNDLGDADKYASLVNYWAAVWTQRGAQVYYASVNPVWANSFGMTEERVEQFNNRLKSQLIPQITWLDSHSYLMQSGVHASDGVHYKDDTNLVLYNYYMTMIGAV